MAMKADSASLYGLNVRRPHRLVSRNPKLNSGKISSGYLKSNSGSIASTKVEIEEMKEASLTKVSNDAYWPDPCHQLTFSCEVGYVSAYYSTWWIWSCSFSLLRCSQFASAAGSSKPVFYSWTRTCLIFNLTLTRSSLFFLFFPFFKSVFGTQQLTWLTSYWQFFCKFDLYTMMQQSQQQQHTTSVF